jgi:maleylacetate reductase
VKEFCYTAHAARVIFGVDSLRYLQREIELLGATRALVLSTPEQRAAAEDISARLGSRAAGIYAKAVMHVPIETAEAARAVAKELKADCCVAVGGGSTIGLGKAIALTSNLPILAIPTTFAGSEMTPIYGITAQGQKKTGRDARVLPKTVIYDPNLLATLPAKIAGPSGMNAIAHCAEALYAQEGNPIASNMAEEGIRALARGLPLIVRDPRNLEAKSDAFYGAWLAGTCLGQVGMALHHKLCHTLGGSFNLPHAETHTVVLPHALAYNRGAALEAMTRIAGALEASDAAQGVYDLAASLNTPLSLKDLGMREDGLDRAAQLATTDPYWNPRPIERDAIRKLLDDAYWGRRPVQ